MLRRSVFCFALILLCSLCGFAQSNKSSPQTTKELQIGFVDNSNHQFQDGCGCSFWLGGSEPKGDPKTWKFILIGNYEKQAWMNIGGEIVQLRLVRDTTRYKGKIGDRFFQTYQSGPVKVRVECTASGYGDTHAVFCDANIIVTRGHQKKTVKAQGSCGC